MCQKVEAVHFLALTVVGSERKSGIFQSCSILLSYHYELYQMFKIMTYQFKSMCLAGNMKKQKQEGTIFDKDYVILERR